MNQGAVQYAGLDAPSVYRIGAVAGENDSWGVRWQASAFSVEKLT
jgi:hypothetical protein